MPRRGQLGPRVEKKKAVLLGKAPRGDFYKGTYLIELGRGFCFFEASSDRFPQKLAKARGARTAIRSSRKRTLDIAYCVMENISR